LACSLGSRPIFALLHAAINAPLGFDTSRKPPSAISHSKFSRCHLNFGS
jgi:hypothetical protein